MHRKESRETPGQLNDFTRSGHSGRKLFSADICEICGSLHFYFPQIAQKGAERQERKVSRNGSKY
jgi:hypothetical protein